MKEQLLVFAIFVEFVGMVGRFLFKALVDEEGVIQNGKVVSSDVHLAHLENKDKGKDEMTQRCTYRNKG